MAFLYNDVGGSTSKVIASIKKINDKIRVTVSLITTHEEWRRNPEEKFIGSAEFSINDAYAMALVDKKGKNQLRVTLVTKWYVTNQESVVKLSVTKGGNYEGMCNCVTHNGVILCNCGWYSIFEKSWNWPDALEVFSETFLFTGEHRLVFGSGSTLKAKGMWETWMDK